MINKKLRVCREVPKKHYNLEDWDSCSNQCTIIVFGDVLKML